MLSVFASVATWLEHFHGVSVYALCGAFVFGEAAVLLGFVVPGETAAVVAGALASLHEANIVVMLIVIIGCAIVGDSVGYEVGKYLGPWLLERRPLRGSVRSGRGGGRRATRRRARGHRRRATPRSPDWGVSLFYRFLFSMYRRNFVRPLAIWERTVAFEQLSRCATSSAGRPSTSRRISAARSRGLRRRKPSSKYS